MRATGVWESAECTCSAQFATQQEAGEHKRLFGHSIAHVYGSRLAC